MRRFRYAEMFFPSFLALGFYFVSFVGALSSNAVERERERIVRYFQVEKNCLKKNTYNIKDSVDNISAIIQFHTLPRFAVCASA